MPNKLPKFFDKHKICIICEGNEEYEYLNRLKNLKVWNEQYDISLVNAGGNGNIPARYQDRYQNGADELVLVFCDTEKKPHEQYEDIKRKINEFHGVDSAANEVIMFGNPCTVPKHGGTKVSAGHFHSGRPLFGHLPKTGVHTFNRVCPIQDLPYRAPITEQLCHMLPVPYPYFNSSGILVPCLPETFEFCLCCLQAGSPINFL